MKTTLTKDNPSGWYLCRYGTVQRNIRCESGRFWYESGEESELAWEIVEPLADSDVLELRHKLATSESYTQSLHKCCLDYLSDLRKAREENAVLTARSQELLEQSERFEAELAALRKQPYPMRKADKPDCVGLWLCVDDGRYVQVNEGDVNNPRWNKGGRRSFVLIGPIPVLPVEQQPPQVVTVRCKKDGKSYRAISFGPNEYVLLDDNGVGFSHASKEHWEAAQ